MKIYTTEKQCALFNANYHTVGEMLICSADALLRTKDGDGYDQEHRDYLEPIRNKTLVMERTSKCGAGWWEVIKTI